MRYEFIRAAKAAGSYALAVAAFAIVVILLLGCADEDEITLIESKQTELEGASAEGKASDLEDTKPKLDTASLEGEETGCTLAFVFVCGAVKNPGVYKLPDDDRISDAILAAGGFDEGAVSDYLNLAEHIQDGEKIFVPYESDIEDDGIRTQQGVSQMSETNDGKINLNTATKEQLMTLPGVGESKANKIIEYREANGGFSTTEDIMQISGIKEGMYNKIKDSICTR